MELNIKKIQQMNLEEIYNILLPIINEIYLSFRYLNISEKEYKKFVLNVISDSKKTYRGNIKYSLFIKNKIIFKLTKIFLFNPNTSFNLLNNYINQNFTNTLNIDNIIKYFKILNDFLLYYNYIPSSDLLIELISKNEIFNEMITTIFNKYRVQIMAGTAEKIFNDNLLLLTLEVWVLC